MNNKTVTLAIEYEILYNNELLDPNREITIACYDPFKKTYTDCDDFYGIETFIEELKNYDKDNNTQYSCYENRTVIAEVTYDSSIINNIEESIKIFQWGGEGDEMIPVFDTSKIGSIEIIKINESINTRDTIEKERIQILKNSIIKLLEEQNKKISVSDINAFLKHGNLDEIKELCEKMYQDSEISFAGNGRYFILTEGGEEKKETKPEKTETVDVKSELKKYKEMLDEGLITQEQYDAKSNELLGL